MVAKFTRCSKSLLFGFQLLRFSPPHRRADSFSTSRISLIGPIVVLPEHFRVRTHFPYCVSSSVVQVSPMCCCVTFFGLLVIPARHDRAFSTRLGHQRRNWSTGNAQKGNNHVCRTTFPALAERLCDNSPCVCRRIRYPCSRGAFVRGFSTTRPFSAAVRADHGRRSRRPRSNSLPVRRFAGPRHVRSIFSGRARAHP